MLFADRLIVTMADVDAAGIIYFASPLRWAERMYSTWMREIGRPHSQLLAEGVATPAVNVNVDYRAHVAVDDELRLELTAARIGTTSFTLRCECFVGVAERAAVETRTTHVYARYTHPGYDTEARTEKRPLPPWLRTALETGYREATPTLT